MFQNNILAGASAAGGYTIDQSIRFNRSDSPYLTRTFSTDEGDTWTLSLWLKRGQLSTGNNQYFFSEESGASGMAFVTSTDTLRLYNGSTVYNSTPVYRDPSGWYHIVFSSNAGTWVCYVNGEEVSGFTGTATLFNRNNQWNIGRHVSNTNHFDGYLAEIYWIGDQALAPTDFGEYNDDGVWIAKRFAGAYGTNGFYITGEDSADLGADYSGNGNDFTSSGLTTADQVTDTPTENYATINPLTASNATMSFHEANLKVEMNAAYPGNVLGSIGVNSGKYYWEVTMSGTGSPANGYATGVGVAQWANKNTDPGAVSTPYSHYIDSRSNFVNNGTTTGNSTSFTAGDIIGVALDCDNDEITFYKNNTIVGSAQSLEAGQTWFPLFKNSTGVADLQYNPDFGQLGYTYTPPTGFSALSTTNLPTPAIKDGSAYFQTTLFTGTGAVDNEINQTGNSTFQPDVVWIKQRNKVDNHVLTDAVRGEPKALYPNDTSSELVGTGGITSLDPDGFTLSGDGSVWNNVNQSGITAAAWQWLAGNGTASNTDGTITSTVSANQTTGFSIVSWTGSGNSSDNVGTGLSSSTTLGMAIVKRRDSTSEWQVGHVGNQGLNFAYHIELNSTAANSGSAPYFMGTQSNADKLYLSSGSLTSSATYIAYCWNEVEGFSKFGSYTGNGSADGPFVWCGFRPAFVILKNSSAAGYDWQTWDAARSPANVVDDLLRPNATTAETIAANLDFTSNGFKIRTSGSGSNLSGSNYIFMAFAEHPFGGSTVAPVPAR